MRSYEINSRSDKFVQVSRLLRDKRLVQPYGIWSGIVLATICREKRHQNEGRKKINGIVWLDSWSVSRAFGYYALFMGAQTSMNIH